MFTNILSLNFFELFEVPVSYELNLEDVQLKYTVLQQAVHPDKFANASDQEKRLSMQQTSHVNDAFQTLKDPVLRAVYLLKLKGVDVNLENETTMDMEFLMQQMEMREVLADIKAYDNPLDKLDELGRNVKNSMTEMTTQFSDKFEADELDEGRELIRKLQFMKKAKRQIAELSAKLEDELL